MAVSFTDICGLSGSQKNHLTSFKRKSEGFRWHLKYVILGLNIALYT
jgi:hypothetical protein